MRLLKPVGWKHAQRLLCSEVEKQEQNLNSKSKYIKYVTK